MFARDLAAAFAAAVKYAANEHGQETGPVGFAIRRSNGDTLPPDTPRHIAADALEDEGRSDEAHKLRTPGLITKTPYGGPHGKIKRARYTSQHVLEAAQRVVGHLHDWSGGQYEPPQIEVNDGVSYVPEDFADGELPEELQQPTPPDHVRVTHNSVYDGPTFHNVHHSELGSHIADVIEDDVNGADYGWNTDGIAEGDADSIGISSEVGMLPLRSHESPNLHRLAQGDSLDHDRLGRAEREATRLAESYRDQATSLEQHDDHDEDAVRELHENADAAREIAFRINQHRNDMSEHQNGMGEQFDRLLRQLREAPHVEVDPDDAD